LQPTRPGGPFKDQSLVARSQKPSELSGVHRRRALAGAAFAAFRCLDRSPDSGRFRRRWKNNSLRLEIMSSEIIAYGSIILGEGVDPGNKKGPGMGPRGFFIDRLNQ
jgi:hypothetical protein